MEYIWNIIGLGVCIFIASMILPWVLLARINRLEKKLTDFMRNNPHATALETNRPTSNVSDIQTTKPDPIAVTPTPQRDMKGGIIKDVAADIPVLTPHIKPKKLSTTQPSPIKEKPSFEKDFGARFPVWIGGIALAFAGFFMVKYSIETNMLSPGVRTVMGFVFGVALFAAADYVRFTQKDLTNVQQSLAGASIMVWYACVYVAANIYDFISPSTGFILMAMITVLAVVQALRYGPPIAVLALIGGFITPILMQTGSVNVPVLLGYLFIVYTGMMLTIRHKQWWSVTFLATGGALLWSFVWLATMFKSGQALYGALFICGIVAVNMWVVSERTSERNNDALDANTKASRLLSALVTFAVAFVLMAFIIVRTKFGLSEWALFGVLTVAGLFLTLRKYESYYFIPVSALVISWAIVWTAQAQIVEKGIILAFAAGLYAVFAFIGIYNGRKAFFWSLLSGAAVLGSYILGYFLYGHNNGIEMDYFWGYLALILSFGAIAMVEFISRHPPKDTQEYENSRSLFAILATAFISIALTIEVSTQFLAVAFALQVMALAWIATKTTIRYLKEASAIVTCCFGVIIYPQIILLGQLGLYSMWGFGAHIVPPILQMPWLQLGVPTLCFLAAAQFMRPNHDGVIVKIYEVTAIALFTIMAFYVIRGLLHPGVNVLVIKAHFIERAILTNLLFIFGLVVVVFGLRYKREWVSMAGFGLFSLAAFRIGYFDLLIYNPWFSSKTLIQAGPWPIVNALWLVYAIPMIWLGLLCMTIKRFKYIAKLQISQKMITLFLALAGLWFISIQIHHACRVGLVDPSLYGVDRLNYMAETYALSVAWIVYGIAMLLLGTFDIPTINRYLSPTDVTEYKTVLRRVSLVVMIVTVGKVFLFDASSLTGLYRVFSFMGLGISLIGLSWFYTKVVFKRTDI